jgi:hypothetical protein
VEFRHRRAARAFIALSVATLVTAPAVALADWTQFHNTLSRRGATHRSTLVGADAKAEPARDLGRRDRRLDRGRQFLAGRR